MPSAWNDERIELVKDLWAKGYSASSIAAELRCGLSRNAVIGKVNRLGLSQRRKAAALPPRVRKPYRHTPKEYGHHGAMLQRINRAPATEPSGLTDLPPDQSSYAVSLMQLEPHHCRYPLGEPTAGMKYCGAPKQIDSYCARHAALCYRQISPMPGEAGGADRNNSPLAAAPPDNNPSNRRTA